jgi:hypothetical protein
MAPNTFPSGSSKNISAPTPTMTDFSSVSAFIAVFKKAFGTTPGRYIVPR